MASAAIAPTKQFYSTHGTHPAMAPSAGTEQYMASRNSTQQYAPHCHPYSYRYRNENLPLGTLGH